MLQGWLLCAHYGCSSMCLGVIAITYPHQLQPWFPEEDMAHSRWSISGTGPSSGYRPGLNFRGLGTFDSRNIGVYRGQQTSGACIYILLHQEEQELQHLLPSCGHSLMPAGYQLVCRS